MKDLIAKEIWNHLCADFMAQDANVKLFVGEARQALETSFSCFRKYNFPQLDDSLSVRTYKYCTQLRSFFDRFIADSDDFKQSDLNKEAIANFVDSQKNVLSGLPGSERSHRVLREMRRILRLILGECPDLSQLDDWRFPQKASEGVKRENGYLHEKLNHLTSTKEQLPLIQGLLRDCALIPRYVKADSVSVVAVEKKWNKSRIIAPDTVASGCVSNALGRYIEERLRASVGIDIKVQQHLHRKLVREASRKGHLATLDLSAASDSISIPLLRRVLPSAWWRLLRRCRTRLFRVDKKGPAMSLQSFMTMGVGYTFPLQTAVYYSLIQATKNLLRSTRPYDFPGIISVYGDDCIFPTSLYPFVKTVLEDLGFKVNGDKSFAHGFFRESCGEDCFKGQSVRPAFMKWDEDTASGSIYQMLNLLLRRYNMLEIPSTIRYLVKLVHSIDGIVLRVPPHFSERAGIHVASPECFCGEGGRPYLNVEYSPIYYIPHEGKSTGQLGYYEFMALAPRSVLKKAVHRKVDVYNTLVDSLHDPSPQKFYKGGYMLGSEFVAVGRCENENSGGPTWKRLKPKKTHITSVTAKGVGNKGAGRRPEYLMLIPSKAKSSGALFQRNCLITWWNEE